MRDLPIEVQQQIAQRHGVSVCNFIWFQARNRATNAVETMGLWDGDDVQNFVINGQPRTYHGAGALIGVGLLKQYVGLNIRQLPLTASQVAPELDMLIRGYEAKMAPVEVHQGFFSLETNELIAPPQRVFKGWINNLLHKTGAKGEPGSLTINLVGNTRLLTKTATVRRSHETQIQRRAGDSFFRNVSITGAVQTAWGSKTVGATTGNPFGGRSGLMGLINFAQSKR